MPSHSRVPMELLSPHHSPRAIPLSLSLLGHWSQELTPTSHWHMNLLETVYSEHKLRQLPSHTGTPRLCRKLYPHPPRHGTQWMEKGQSNPSPPFLHSMHLLEDPEAPTYNKMHVGHPLWCMTGRGSRPRGSSLHPLHF